jgi:propanediol dehydratase small subunit
MGNVLIADKDYPLYEKRPELIKTPAGKSVNEITIENVLTGKVTSEDCKISAETLEYQAQIAESVGNFQIAGNFRRAAELTGIPDNRILEIYNCMRPYNSTEQELLDIAEELEKKYNANINAALLRETAEVYKDRKLLRVD